MSEESAEDVRLAEINALRRAGVLSADQYVDAAYLARDATVWTEWAQRALLALGVGHLLAGIVFFFAYNWDDLSPVSKFAILEGGIVIGAVGALVIGIRRPAGDMLLIATTILIGTLLAVIGQVYQTGADAYTLFTLWALLAVPFVVASQKAAHWLVWLLIAYAALSLYEYQILRTRDLLSSGQFLSLLAAMTTVILAVREYAVRVGADWLASRWTRIVLLAAAVAIVAFPSVEYVLDSYQSELTPVIVFIGLILVLGFVYSRHLPDFAVLAVIVGFSALFLMATGWRALDESIGFDWGSKLQLVLALALLTLWCAGMTAGALKFLTVLRSQIGGARDDV